MRIPITRLIVAVALIAAFAVIGTASASADTTSCTVTEGKIKLSPGLTETAAVQNVQVKGMLTGCSGEESSFTGGKFNLHFKTAEPVACPVLTGPGVGASPEENKIILKWTPSGSGNSIGTASVPITEVAGAALSGVVNEGPFVEDTISGSLNEVYTGGTECGVIPPGKKHAKKVSKGTVSGTLSVA
jgi:hypothetical protein